MNKVSEAKHQCVLMASGGTIQYDVSTNGLLQAEEDSWPIS